MTEDKKVFYKSSSHDEDAEVGSGDKRCGQADCDQNTDGISDVKGERKRSLAGVGHGQRFCQAEIAAKDWNTDVCHDGRSLWTDRKLIARFMIVLFQVSRYSRVTSSALVSWLNKGCYNPIKRDWRQFRNEKSLAALVGFLLWQIRGLFPTNLFLSGWRLDAFKRNCLNENNYLRCYNWEEQLPESGRRWN